MPAHELQTLAARRLFLQSAAGSIGSLALSSLLSQDGLLAAESVPADPLAPHAPHFAPKAKACIFLFMEGAPSQLDLFDPKPKLNELHGQKLPESMTKNVRFAFIQKETAVLMGSNRKWQKYGECGMDLSDRLPHLSTCVDDIAFIRSMHTEAFNHHPGQLLMLTGATAFGRPSMGCWMSYGLGSESKDLPSYVVLNSGRGTSGGASLWSSGFLPTTYQGVLFRNQGEPVLNLDNPPGLTAEMQRLGLDALRDLNQHRLAEVHDPEIATRIASYELAYRMQTAAPQLIDFSDETPETLEAYGVNRTEGKLKGGRGGGAGTFASYSRNCLLARRLVERGVRFVNLFHASWDHHSDIDRELEFNAMMADQPVAALLKDLKQRGMLDSTLVIWGAEFGRTPLGENRAARDSNTGRDHHPFAFSLWMAGGGVKGGQIIGETDEIGWNVIKDPIHVNDLQATILRLFGMDHLRLTYRFKGRDFRLTDVGGKVVPQLIG